MTDRALLDRALRSPWPLPVAVFVLAVAIGCLPSWNVSFWTDEAVTISAATRSLPQVWALVQNIDAVHGLYYALMSLWVDVFDVSEFWMRFPSALAFGGTVVGVLVLTRRLASPATAVLAAIVCTALPRMTWAGIEARPFVFSALLAVWVTWAFLRAADDTRWVRWLVYGVLAVVAVLVNIYLVFVVAGHGLTTLVLHRNDRRRWFAYGITAVASGVVVLPFLLLVRSQQAQLGTSGDRNPLSILRKILINQLFLGETPSADALPAIFGTAWQAAAVVAAAVGLSLMAVALVGRSAAGDDKRSILALALPWLIVPTLVVAAYAVLVSPIYQPRYFTFTAPAGAILIALGLRSLRRRWIAVAASVLYLCAVLIVIVSQRTPFAKSGSDWASAAGTVAAFAEAGDAVYFAPRYDPATTDPITLTSRRVAQSYPQNFVGLEDLTLVETGVETASLDGFSAPLADRLDLLNEYETVWMVYGERSAESIVTESETLFTDAGFTPVVRWSGPRSTVVEYTRTS